MTSSKSAQLEQLGQLLELMRCLRDPENGCAWDRKQTWQSLCRHTLEAVSYTHLTLPTTPYV